jgi:F-type H+-transporting ATPase subunit gamma
MSKLLVYRRRVRSIEQTRHVTKAMQVIASSQLSSLTRRLAGIRPYSRELWRTVSRLVSVVPPFHPLVFERPKKRICLVIVTSDKGLCGAFNHNVIRRALSFIEEHRKEAPHLVVVGKKGWDYFRRRKYPVQARFLEIFRYLNRRKAELIIKLCLSQYLEGEIDAVYLMFNSFRSMLVKPTVVERLLPLPRAKGVSLPGEYNFETVLPRFFVHYLEVELYRALVESFVAEQAARLVAMEEATKNAGKTIDRLTRLLNKTRQATITEGLVEVVAGAEALLKNRRGE